MSDEPDLVTSEGVDEGSAAGTTEGLDDRAAAGDGVLGEPPRGAPVDAVEQAAPDDMESEQSRAARDAAGTGQQLQEGEG